MTTTIRDTKAALLTRWDADTDLGASTTQPIQISRGSVYPTKMEGEYIEISDTRAGAGEAHQGLGTDAKDENYIIEIIISIVRSARENYATLEDRAFVIYGHLWDSIIDWRTESPSFNGISGWMEVRVKSSNEFLVAESTTNQLKERECRITLDLEVTTRI